MTGEVDHGADRLHDGGHGRQEASVLEEIVREREERDRLFAEKMRISWGISVDENEGGANIERMARLMYRILFDQRHLRVADNPKFPDRMQTLRAGLPQTTIEMMPAEDDFLETFRTAMTTGTNFREALYPGAEDTLQGLMDKGFVAIWSQGDVEGVPGQGLSGSGQQVEKIQSALGPAAAEAIQAAEAAGGEAPVALFQDVVHGSGMGGEEQVTATLAEDKKPLLVDIAQDFQTRGIREVAIVEDQLPNLVEAQRVLEQFGMKVIPVWVRQGTRKGRVPKEFEGRSEAELEAEYNAVDGVDKVNAKLRDLKYGTTVKHLFASVVDYDGVMSDDKKREALQAQAVWSALEQRGWITAN